jgi:hypothetical protein
MHPSIDYTSVFSPGPYCADAQFGFTSNCPGREGVMHVIGTPHRTYFKLNERGLRGPFRAQSDSARSVVILGAQSQGFGFGLEEHQTYAAAAARSSCVPVEITNVGLVTHSTPMTWHRYKAVLGGKAGDHFILAFWTPDGSNAIEQELALQRDVFSKITLVGGWNVFIPSWLPHYLRESNVLARGYQRALTLSQYRFDSDVPKHTGHVVDSSSMLGFIQVVGRWARANGAQFSVVLLPASLRSTVPLVRDLQPPLPREVDGARIINLAKELALTEEQNDMFYFPDGHFNERMAQLIGERIGQEVCRVARLTQN